MVSLAAKIARFEPPYQYLQGARAGFDPEIRYILNRCLTGDSLSCRVRDEMISNHLYQCGLNSSYSDEAWREFFTLYNEPCREFICANYPWRDPYNTDQRYSQRDPRLDEYFNTTVLGTLGKYGFRRLSRSFKSDLLERPIVMKWDKGTWSLNMAVWLQIPSLAYQDNIGMPFCFSAGSFAHSLAARVDQQLGAFFAEYEKIFPDVLLALAETIRTQEAWLASYGV